jgi:hypothetical protein
MAGHPAWRETLNNSAFPWTLHQRITDAIEASGHWIFCLCRANFAPSAEMLALTAGYPLTPALSPRGRGRWTPSP